MMHAILISDAGQVNVDDIRDPDWNDHPYDNLVLRNEQKTLLMAFADKKDRNTGFDDFVKHKGMSDANHQWRIDS